MEGEAIQAEFSEVCSSTALLRKYIYNLLHMTEFYSTANTEQPFGYFLFYRENKKI